MLSALLAAALMGTAHAITVVWSSDTINKETHAENLNVKSVSVTFTLSENATGAIFQLRHKDNANASVSNRLSLGINNEGNLVLQLLGASSNISNQQQVVLAKTPATGTHTLNVTLREEEGQAGNNRYWTYYIFDDGASERLQNTTAQTITETLDSVTFLSSVGNNPNNLSDAEGITVTAFSAYGEMLSDDELKSAPEPTALALFALGAAGLALRRRAA